MKIEHPHETKDTSKGFRFVLPDWLVGTFAKHIDKFKEGLAYNNRLRNHNGNSHNFMQNTGEVKTCKFTSTLAEQLGKEKFKKNHSKIF